jgi:small subunit ribosomal protein S17
MSAETKQRGNPKIEIGIVLKHSMNKTLVVGITTLVQHKFYKKHIKFTKKCYVHDEKNIAQCGDKVKIIETKPLSKMKRWRLIEVLAK